MTDRHRRLLERAATLKGELVDFALAPPFQRLLREQLKRCAHPELDGDSQVIEAVDALLFEHRYDDGSMVLDRFLAKRRSLTPGDRGLVESWRESVHGIFEVLEVRGDQLELWNLFDEMGYPVHATAGPDAVEGVDPGTFLITRVLPVDDVWLLSGTQGLFGAEHRAGMAKVVAERALEHPDLVLRNPDKRRMALETARSMHESFLACFDTDLLVVTGREVASTYQRFIACHTARVNPDADADERARRLVDTAVYDEAFAHRDSVAVRHYPDHGLWFFADYALALEAFKDPDLLTQGDAHREVVQGYLEEETIPPWVLEELSRAHPHNADAVFGKLLGDLGFQWETDGPGLCSGTSPTTPGRRSRPASCRCRLSHASTWRAPACS